MFLSAGSDVNIPSLFAVLATGVLLASASAAGPESAKPLDEFQSLIDAASSQPGLHGVLAPDTAFSPRLLAASDGPLVGATASHEGKAAAHFTGRRFLARGRALDAVAEDARIERANGLAPPDGWDVVDEKLIHRASGLECPAAFTLPGDDHDRILALTTITTYERNRPDVSCSYAIEGDAAVTVYASFYPSMSLEEHAASAVAAIRQSFTVKGEIPVVIVDIERKGQAVSTDPLPAALSGGFDIGEVNGRPYKTAIWLAKTRGWHVKARATYAQSDLTAEVVAAMLFGVNYLNVDARTKGDPSGAGPDV